MTSEYSSSGGLHPSEISTREFPRARKGFEKDSVVAWLRTVERAYADLVAENERLRGEKIRVTSALQAARDTRSSTAVRVALTSATLERARRGYDRAQVESLLTAAAEEIARLETRASVLEAELATVGSTNEWAWRVAALEEQLAAIASSPAQPQSRSRGASVARICHGEQRAS